VNSVTNISQFKQARNARNISVSVLAQELRKELAQAQTTNAPADLPGHDMMLEELEGVSTEHLVKLHMLALKRERFEREMAAEEAELKAELEHAAYFAYMAGVPEEAIAEIDDRTADALSNAQMKVQDHA
jgi:hypothetical protein